MKYSSKLGRELTKPKETLPQNMMEMWSSAFSQKFQVVMVRGVVEASQ
jgi:hypothetical protein